MNVLMVHPLGLKMCIQLSATYQADSFTLQTVNLGVLRSLCVGRCGRFGVWSVHRVRSAHGRVYRERGGETKMHFVDSCGWR